MTGTVHELFPGAVEVDEPTLAPPLPVMRQVVDIALHLERVRVASEQALSVLRACPTMTTATADFLNQICDGWVQADAANAALAHLLECKGQA